MLIKRLFKIDEDLTLSKNSDIPPTTWFKLKLWNEEVYYDISRLYINATKSENFNIFTLSDGLSCSFILIRYIHDGGKDAGDLNKSVQAILHTQLSGFSLKWPHYTSQPPRHWSQRNQILSPIYESNTRSRLPKLGGSSAADQGHLKSYFHRYIK